MPRTTKTGNANLRIDVASPPGWTYAPGNTIIDTVQRLSHIIAPEATLRLSLVGRVKTKVGPKDKRSHYRANWFLFGTTTTQVLFRGPLHVPKDSSDGGNELSWPFSLCVPMKPADSALRGRYTEEGLLSLDLNGIAQHTLPGTFFSSNYSWNTPSEGFVEYYLEASLQYHQRGLYKSHKATVPITIRHQAPVVLPDYGLQRRKVDGIICSQRLLPGMEHANLNFKQRTQKLLGSSKVPRLDNPSPIPLTLSITIVPQQEKTTCTSVQGAGLKVRLNWVNMTIRSSTNLLAMSDYSVHLNKGDCYSAHHNLNLEKAFRDLEVPIELLFDKDHHNHPVNIGSMFQLGLRSNGLYSGNRRLAYVLIQPDVVAYNLRYTHRLEMAVSLTIAKEEYTIPVSADLMILAAD